MRNGGRLSFLHPLPVGRQPKAQSPKLDRGRTAPQPPTDGGIGCGAQQLVFRRGPIPMWRWDRSASDLSELKICNASAGSPR